MTSSALECTVMTVCMGVGMIESALRCLLVHWDDRECTEISRVLAGIPVQQQSLQCTSASSGLSTLTSSLPVSALDRQSGYALQTMLVSLSALTSSLPSALEQTVH